MEKQQEEQVVSEPAEEQSDQSKPEQKEMQREPSIQETGILIANELGETTQGSRQQIRQIVWALGRTQARQFLMRTREIEAGGGLLLPDGSRRRTPGGVFFHLVRSEGQPKPGRSLYYKRKTSRQASAGNEATSEGKPAAKQEKIPAPPPAPPFDWQERSAVITEIGNEKGSASAVKITVIGQLGKYIEKGSCVIGIMQHSGEKLPALPKGVPAPQAVKTNYVVYISAKQWKNVAATVNDPEDILIVEGFPQVDAKTGAISVFVSNVTSKKLQLAKRQGQQKG